MSRPTIGSAAEPPVAGMPRQKTAVVVVHGMGEQRPMETLWGLVAALFTGDDDFGPADQRMVWSKPEDLSGTFELRRVTTSEVRLEGGQDKRIDFFEFYWAHLMTGNTVTGVTSWLTGLLVRDPRTVPPRLRTAWVSGLSAFLVVGLALLVVGLKKSGAPLPHWLAIPWMTGAAAILAALYGAFATAWLAPVAGDAARYLSATPNNVAARQKIREAGVDLLNKLQASGLYDRVVIIGHSLGSVVAYDMLNFAWGRLSTNDLQDAHGPRSAPRAAMRALERAATILRNAEPAGLAAARASYRQAQRTYQAALRDAGRIWLVTDFVSAGSPLSKADVLLARDADGLAIKIDRREAPVSPPQPDVPGSSTYRFSYKVGARWAPHHAAVFAPVVWTNLWFPSRALVVGDLISGPCAPLLGRGVRDVRIPIGGLHFRHLDYWKDPEKVPTPRWIVALRRAVNLRLSDEDGLWATSCEDSAKPRAKRP